MGLRACSAAEVEDVGVVADTVEAVAVGDSFWWRRISCEPLSARGTMSFPRLL